ncbi:hypothetical protein [Saccharothrix algeriensis]|uniref:Uncharacterized protein n=1 Tax=Saccharothrix algeriensis TaxID=173560 RepID=A0A8T8HUE1_9PSEU|nr:hypothetical protein [Saccharothrix algeriensis]MBM7813608.1 hypothetical protein [Saccharothrix algeriensis]QTR02096.1 hypothetical protein J7S33_23140 [Saccharothrix algeriensis]
MSVPRTLIWTPAPTAELQLALHRAVAGPAALVPVGSGTVVLPRREIGFPAAVRFAAKVREVGERADLVRWDARGAVWSDGVASGYSGAARRLVGLVGWWRLKAVAGELALPADVAEVRSLVDEGRADTWVTALPDRAGLPINTVLPVVPVTQGGAPLA